MYKSESIIKIAPALLAAQKTMGDATKGSKNPFFKSSYADLNAIREAALPALNDNGVVCLQPTIEVNGKNYVETTLIHESGEWISSLTEIKVAKQNDAQAEGSGISYARRYGLQSLLNIGAVDDDGEKTVVRESSKDLKTPASFNSKKAKEEVKISPKLEAAVKEEIKKVTPEVMLAPKTNGAAQVSQEDEW